MSIPAKKFALAVLTSADTPVLQCRGRLTSNYCEQFRLEVKKLLPDHRRIVLDLAELHFVDSSGLAALLDCYVLAKAAGCDLRLTNANPQIKGLLDRTHLSFVFDTDSK
jgi:anti-anti-sigma factor